MRSSIDQLHQFYTQTPLGRFAMDSLFNMASTFCPQARGCSVAGFGYAVPVLVPYFETCERLIALMPAEQGVMAWPDQSNNVAVLCDENKWPLPDALLDILFVLHGLETSNSPGDVLDECWRTLSDSGRVLFIVTNRLGSWARYDQTPFGYGRPFSIRQLERQLQTHGFDIIQVRGGLFTPPIREHLGMRLAAVWSHLTRHFAPFWAAGVLCVEARKSNREKPCRPRSSGIQRTVRVLLPEKHAPALPKQQT